MDASRARFGKIDCLVVNAGGGNMTPFSEIDEHTFDYQVDTNFKGAFFTIQKALPLLSKGSTVIITSSIASSTEGFMVLGLSRIGTRASIWTRASPTGSDPGQRGSIYPLAAVTSSRKMVLANPALVFCE